MRALRSHAATTCAGRPSRSAPTSSVSAPRGSSARSAQRLARRRRAARRARPAAPPTSLHAREATEKIAPMLARTAFGECGSAQRGPSATHEAPKACAERRIVPTLPGSPTPCRYTHSGPGGLAPALLVDADRARARAERGDRAQRRRLDVVKGRARRARAGQRGSPRRAGARPAPRRARDPRPRRRSVPRARARAAWRGA